MRAFIAIELSQKIKDKIEKIQAELEKYNLSLRWTKPKNLHLTLRFLGDIEEK